MTTAVAASKEKPIWSYFVVPLFALVLGVGAAYLTTDIYTAFNVFVLAILEISLSFDNAVVNASVLRHWDEKWRKRFLVWGILIAVFGMRLVFPIVIVAVAMGAPIWQWGDIANMAFTRPEEYFHHLESVSHLVDAFGAAFLGMVGLSFFLDATKDNHWLGPVEGLLAKAGQIEAVQAGVTLLGIAAVSQYLPANLQHGYLLAGVFGIVTFVAVKALGTLLGGGDADEETQAAGVSDVPGKVIQASVGGFLYLEVLDASFSFDGVIGAFAITNVLLWIMVGLGIGALTVREMTVLATDRGALAEFKFLEHGAFYAIIALAVIMGLKPIVHTPEWFTGTVGAAMIGVAFLHSWFERQAEKKAALAA